MVDFEDEEVFVEDDPMAEPMADDLDDASLEADLDSDDLVDDVEDDEGSGGTVDVDVEVVADPVATEDVDDFGDDFDEAGVALPPTATFDVDAVDEDEPVIEAYEDEDDSDDAVREGEFICRSCFMAKRDSAIADEERMLCLDCV